jgi:hypothetical protein
MKIKLKKREVLDLFRLISSDDGMVKNEEENDKWFNYALVYTEESIKPTVAAIVSISAPKKKYSQYEAKREQLCQKYVEIGDDGEYVKNGDWTLVIKKGVAEMAKDEFEALDSEYEDVLAERTSDLSDYLEILEEECEIDVEQVEIEHFPDRLNNKKMIKALRVLIKRS